MNLRWGFSCKGERRTSDEGRKGGEEVEMREGEVRSVVFCWLRTKEVENVFLTKGLESRYRSAQGFRSHFLCKVSVFVLLSAFA